MIVVMACNVLMTKIVKLKKIDKKLRQKNKKVVVCNYIICMAVAQYCKSDYVIILLKNCVCVCVCANLHPPILCHYSHSH